MNQVPPFVSNMNGPGLRDSGLPGVTDFSGGFEAELSRFAAEQGDARMTAIAERAGAPLRVAVRGRRGVRRGTVARALDRAAPLEVAPPECVPDVVVYVTAEVINPRTPTRSPPLAARLWWC